MNDSTLYLIRHGRTAQDSNVGAPGTDKVTSWSDIPLVKDGEEGAMKTGDELKGAGLEAIYSSDLKRARQTAALVAKASEPEPEVVPMKGLRPWNLGAFTGRQAGEIKDELDDYILHPEKVVPEGESFGQYTHRVFGELRQILDEVEEGATLGAVVHSWTMKSVAAWIAAGAKDDDSMDDKVFDKDAPPPAAYAILTRKSGKWTMDYPKQPAVKGADVDYVQDESGRFNGSRGHGGAEGSSEPASAPPPPKTPRKKESPEEIQARTDRVMGKLPVIAKAIPALRTAVESDLHLGDADKNRVAAAVVKLMDSTTMRVGSEKYAQANGTFGASSLRKNAVTVDHNTVHVTFKGKAGKNWERSITDPALAATIRHLETLPGDKLMQFHGKGGEVRPFDETDARDYMAAHGITPKNLRTYHANEIASRLLRESGPPKSADDARSTIKRVVEETSKQLGNTPAVCRSNYINPAVLEAYAGNYATKAHKEPWDFPDVLLHLEKRVTAGELTGRDPFPEDVEISDVDDEAGEEDA